MVPLRGVNRVIASRGIEALSNTTKPGLVALKEAAGISGKKRFSSGHVSFAIGPRINAAGRLEDPNQVFELLITKSSTRAKTIAKKIDRLNKQRRAIEESVRQDCMRYVNDKGLRDAPAFAIYGEDYHAGVIGIVAQRLIEQFHRPSTVMTLGEAKVGQDVIPVVKGSVRSIKGFNVAEVLQECDDLLMKHGGHAAAGGFSLLPENLEAFQARFVELAEKHLTEDDYVRERVADTEVTLKEVDFDVVHELTSLQPFGIGNPSPLLVCRDIDVDSVQSLSNGHLRLRFSQGDTKVMAVAWRFRGHPLFAKGKRVNVAFQPEINNYNGLSTVQLNIKEVWQSL
jgi:single-stranded-DNA-specific exonuclease